MNLAAEFEIARLEYENILDTLSTEFEWWSNLKGPEYGEVTVPEFTRHWLYPTIPIIVSPVADKDHIVLPIAFGDQYTHMGSTKIEYLENPYLNPSKREETIVSNGIPLIKPASYDWRIKRYDKLVSTTTGQIYWVNSAHRSTMGTHTLLSLTHKNPMERAAF